MLTLALIASVVLGGLEVSASGSGRRPVGEPVKGVVALLNASAPRDDVFSAQFCGGVLIGLRIVLTAAHCVIGRDARSVHALVGADRLCIGEPVDGVRRAATRIDVHADYDPATGRFDLARVTLDKAVSAEWVREIEVPRASTGPGAVLGWGVAPATDIPSCRLMRTAVRQLDPETCRAAIGVYGLTFDPDSMLCAIGADPGAADACVGDSGGPLIRGESPRDGAVIGIVSWGRGCRAGVPGVYARADVWR